MLQIRIGNAHYNCSCARNVTSDESEHPDIGVTSAPSDSSNIWLTVGLSVAFGVLVVIIFIITIIVCITKVCRKHRTWTREDTTAFSNDGTGSTQYQADDRQSHAMPAAGSEVRDPPNYDDEFSYTSLEKSAKC